MAKYTNERIKKALKAYLKKINKKYKIKQAILFGSRARNDNLLTSDVDLILISKNFENKKFNERMIDALELWTEDISLEPLCYTPEEFEKKKKQIGIVSTAVKEGKEIAIT